MHCFMLAAADMANRGQCDQSIDHAARSGARLFAGRIYPCLEIEADPATAYTTHER